ncbi:MULTISPECIES: non-homologous end joining protein Ku [unclassified Streptomyces]|uniref:non-homologous end joining protein Ku n=1 Tax=unclassified Streptomyces TaxID=2593676 RepID=UPI0022B708D5|nr:MULTISPECIES: Ku protein [unclassified Streptomyces]MCZ7414344.1 Ku protein [Streptomyces sp. WMMC897]MCZ7431299.1 Ku protein [Streptomyces sp. WMMC1477]
MARPMWSGVLSFGLVTLPVRLYTATEDHTVHFRQLERGTSDRVRRKRVNERTGEEVDYDDIVKGYEVSEGEYVVVERDELEEIAPGKSQLIDVRGFVDLAAVEPVYFANTYYLAPREEEYGDVYALLCGALAEAGRAGIATVTMRGREHLVAVRAHGDVLALHTLHWADEVRDPHEELPALPAKARPERRKLRTARQLVDAMAIEWRPEDYHDTYGERVLRLIEAKAEGEEVVRAEEAPRPTNVVDLMDALERSVEQARSGRREPGGKRARQDGRAELAELTKDELYHRAADAGVRGRSRMSRDELLDALTEPAA